MKFRTMSRLSFHAQLVLYFLAVTTSITFFFYFYINYYLLDDVYNISKSSQEEIFRKGFDSRAQATLKYISLGLKYGMSEESYDAEMIADVIRWLQQDKSVLFLFLFDKSSKEILLEKVYDTDWVAGKLHSSLTFNGLNELEKNKHNYNIIVSSIEFKTGIGDTKLFIGFSNKELQQHSKTVLDNIMAEKYSNTWFLFVRTILISVLGLFIAWVISIRVTKPIKDLNFVTGRIADGDMEMRADENQGPIEIKHLAKTFNKMIRRIIESQEELFNEMAKYNASLDEQNRNLKKANDDLQNEMVVRKTVETALLENRERMDIALEASQAGLWDLDVRTGKFVVDDRMLHILDRDGYKGSITIDMWLKSGVPDEKQYMEQTFRDFLNGTQDTLRLEHKMFLISNRWIWADIRAKVFLKDENGRPLRVIGTINDITSSKKVAEAVRHSERLLRAIIDTTPLMIIYLDETLTIRQINKVYEELINMPKEMILGSRIDQIENTLFIDQLKKNIAEMYSTKSIITFEIELKHHYDIKYYLAYLNPNLSEKGEILGSVFVAIDHTFEKKSEQAIKESEAKFRVISESAPDGIIIVDSQGRVAFWNNAAERIFGYSVEEVQEKSIQQYIMDTEFLDNIPSEHDLYMSGNYKNIKTKTIELYARGKDNKIFPADISLSSVMMNGQWHIVAIVRDISERKSMEMALQKAKEEAETANRAKSEFLANMSHEIRTPMNAIMGFSQLLQDKVNDMQLRSYVEAISVSGKSLLNLINDILDLSKIEAGKLELEFEAVNPNNIFKEIENIFAFKIEEKGIQFITHREPNLPKGLILDEIRLRQVMLNLVGNALKFTHKGSIRMSVRQEESAQDSSKISLLFSVEDTGIGIPENQQQKIFEAFRQQSGQSTRKYGGTGLGLAITKRLVEMMGGTIHLKSEPGVGSTFEVKLDNVSIASVISDNESPVDHAVVNIRFSDTRVLLVDDIEINRRLIKEYLVESDIVFIEAENGLQAIEMALKEKPDIILMDMKMPEMDGYEATRKIRATDSIKNIPIIALTASAMKGDEAEIKSAGCSGYLSKPVDRYALSSEIAKFLPAKVSGQSMKDADKEAAEILPEDSDVAVTEPEKLLLELKGAYSDKCIRLQQRLVIGEVKEFAIGLNSLSARHNAPFLEKYSSLLSVLANSFDLVNIRKTLDSYSDILNTVSNCCKNN